MTFIPATMSQPAESAQSRSFALPIAILGALALGIAATLGRAEDVWRTGAFFDTDDALRMTQVRNLLAGQSWYDMTVARMDPPGSFMHWSRTVDVPLVLFMKFFGLFAGPATAEALTRLAFPLALLAALYVAVAWASRQFGDEYEQIVAVGLAFATGSVFTQFIPGRIDHHAPQIVLLVLMTGAALAAFDPSRAKFAGVSGALAAVSLSISVENLPFILVLATAQPLAWIFRGDEQRTALLSYALGLGAGLVACFFATIGPQRWLVPACDALSVGYALAGLAGAGGLAALAALSPRLHSVAIRFSAAAMLGAAPIAALKLTAPLCFGDPFVGLDPLVRSIWLDNVAEVQPLFALARSQPAFAATLGLPIAAALLATIVCAVHATGVRRARLTLLAALIAAGLAMTFWGVRVYSSVAPLAAIGGAAAVTASLRRFKAKGAARAALALLFSLPFAAAAYALVLPADAPPTAGGGTMSCLRPEAMKPLDALPTGLVFAPIDSGSHLLAFTRHSVLGAPYHRNNRANRLVIDAFLAPPNQAERLVRSSGADYLVICPAQMQAVTIAGHAPQGLAAALIAGRIPAWLSPVDIKSAPNLAFRVNPTK